MFCGIFYIFYYLMGNYEPVLEKAVGSYSPLSQEEWEFTFPKNLVLADRRRGRTD